MAASLAVATAGGVAVAAAVLLLNALALVGAVGGCWKFLERTLLDCEDNDDDGVKGRMLCRGRNGRDVRATRRDRLDADNIMVLYFLFIYVCMLM